MCQLCHIWGGTLALARRRGCCSCWLSSCLEPPEQRAAAGAGSATEVSKVLFGLQLEPLQIPWCAFGVNNVTRERLSAERLGTPSLGGSRERKLRGVAVRRPLRRERMRMALESRKVSSEFNSGGFVVFHTPANFRLRGCLMRTRGEMEERSRRPPAPARWRPFTPGAAGAALRPDRDGAGSGPGRGGSGPGRGAPAPTPPHPPVTGNPRAWGGHGSPPPPGKDGFPHPPPSVGRGWERRGGFWWFI